MATLNSPGVLVTVIDESFYTPAAPGTVPLLFVTSSQDKTNAGGTIAAGTTAANTGKLWLMTSQRDLADTFGVPQFYTDASGNALHGNELNEYGLQAAYSLLGVSSRAYIIRADVNTTNLIPSSSMPKGNPEAGQYWIDTNDSKYGIKEWNQTTLTFVDKTPIVLNDDSDAGSFSADKPAITIGNIGDYCLIITGDNTNRLFYKTSGVLWDFVLSASKSLEMTPHYQVPNWTSGTADKSVWIVTTTANNGANWSVKRFNSASQSWDKLTAPIYDKVLEATAGLDTKGGAAIPIGSVFIETNYDNNANNPFANFKAWRRANTGATTIVSSLSPKSGAGTYRFLIKETLAGSKTWYGATTTGTTITISGGTTTTSLASLIPAGIAAAGLTNIISSYNATSDSISISHKLGGDFEMTDITAAPLAALGFIAGTTDNLYIPAPGDSPAAFLATNWSPLTYVASDDAPYNTPADGTLWYNSVVDEVDIMYHNGTTWVGYRDSTAFPNSDPAGPIVSATAPAATNGQSDGTALVAGDIWISTAEMDRYGKDIYVYSTTAGWVKQDVTDQSTSNGWLFADARWANTGTTLTASPIVTLLTSNYLDPDAPDPAIYPRGMHLVNTRRSGFNVKEYKTGYIDIYANSGRNQRYPSTTGELLDAYETDRWVSQNNVAQDGSGVFGRHAQRAQIVAALKSTIDTNSIIRDTDTVNFNLMATPGYPEAIQNMVGFNVDRGQTAFVIGDTPFRLQPTGTALNAWGKNTALAFDNNDDGAVTYDEYMAMYYPSGFANDNTGNYIVVPPSHMMLRTIINSDAKSYQWFAPAGTRRGGIDNATSVGYITEEGEFKTTALSQGIRDVLDSVKINPIATFTGVGIVAYGQRTRAKNASALDRINVARLVCYLRRQLDVLARPFLFEPNDAQTRREIKAAAESLMLELVGQRALYDYIVVCDETNNTPSRIDRNELYMDIAIEPVKAVEYIYIPLRLKNTGDIKAGL
jgi:hypothetical protein